MNVAAPRIGEIDPTQQPAGALVREQPLIRDPGISLQQAAHHMAETGCGSVLVGSSRASSGSLPITTCALGSSPRASPRRLPSGMW
jgi:hypothetical protein